MKHPHQKKRLERAHPDEPAFRHLGWRVGLRRGWVPWIFPPKRNRFRDEFLWRYNWIAPYCEGKTVLDVPCGMGWGTSLIANTSRLVGIDIAEDAIAEAKQRYGHQAEFKVGSMADLPFPDKTFDVICCLEGIEHVPVDIASNFLADAARVLKTGGRLLLSTPYCPDGQHSGNEHHIHEYQPDEMREKISPLFTIENEVNRTVDPVVVMYMNCVVRESPAGNNL